MKIKNLSGEWDLIVLDSEQVPEGAIEWTTKPVVASQVGRLTGYVKRYGKHNGGRAVFYIVPFTSVKDGSKWFSLYVG